MLYGRRVESGMPTPRGRIGMVRVSALGAVLAVAAACSDSGPANDIAALPGNHYVLTQLVGSGDDSGAVLTVDELSQAWGLAARPGGHFWVGAGGTAFPFAGDVRAAADTALQRLFQDSFTAVDIPGADAETSEQSAGKITGVIANHAPVHSDLFVVHDQPVPLPGVPPLLLTGSARHILATDSGTLSAWTELAHDGAIVRHDGPASLVFDGTAQGMSFSGLAIAPSGDALLVADFGAEPQVRTFDKNWQLVPTTGFVNPFASGDEIDPDKPELGRQVLPGDPAPYNVTTIGDRVFVSYAITQPVADDEVPGTVSTPGNGAEDAAGAGEQQGGAEGEDAGDALRFESGAPDVLDTAAEEASGDRPGKGKLVEYAADGTLVRIIDDAGRLNAPSAVAISPSTFGPLSGKLLVGNTAGAGRILAFDDATGEFVDYVRDASGAPLAVDGLRDFEFGDGVTVGDSDTLYLTAAGEDDSHLSSLRLK